MLKAGEGVGKGLIAWGGAAPLLQGRLLPRPGAVLAVQAPANDWAVSLEATCC